MSSSASPAPGPLARFSASIDKGMERFFHRLGERIADRPWTFIIASLVATAVFASGIAFINIEANAELLYTDQSSAAFDDRDFAEDNFGADNRQSKLFMTARPKGANVLTKANLLELLDVYETAVALTARYDGESYTLSRVCATPNDDGVCDVVSVLDYWSYNRTLIQDDPDILATVNAPARDGIGREIRESSVLGGVTRDAQGNITAAAAFQLEVDNKVIRIAIEGASDDDPYTTEWELAFADLVNDWPRHATSELFVLTQASQDKEFDKAIEADVSLLIVGYILLLIFAAIVMSRNHRVYSSTSISFATVMAVGMAIASSYGVCMAAGVDFSLVVNTLALLLLGLGVDDTFVIMSALRKEKLDVPIRERMATALAKAGASITTTSLTDFAAFLSGTITVLPALQAFCIYAAVGIAFTLVFQVTFVSPCLVLDMRRQKRRKRDVLCCMAPVSDADFQPVVSKPIDSPEEDELAQASDAAEFNYNEPSIMSRMVGRYMPKYTLSVPGIVTIVLGTVALFAVAVYGLTQVETNFDIEWFAPESSYLHDVYDVRDSYFKGRFLPFKTYTKRADYFANQDGLSDISAALKSDSWVLDGSVRSWYDGYLEWLPTSTHAGDLVDGKPGNSADFHSWLVEFLETSESGLQYRSDVIFTDATKTAVLAARMHALLGVRDGSQDNIDAMDSVRVAAKAGQGKAFNGIAFTYPFLFFEGDKIIASETIRNVCVAAAFVFVISFVLLANLHAALIVLFIVALADVALLGFVHWLGLYFNAVSAINLLIAVGILVDSLLHLMREYVVAVGTRDERAREALWMIGGAVANGCISTFLAVVVMANAQSFIFRTFFKMWATILALAVFSGLCLLPVCLKFFGPAELPWRRAEKEAKGKEARTSSSKALGGDVELGGAKADTSGSEDDRAAVRPAQVVPQEQ